jgi:antitoxin FitA
MAQFVVRKIETTVKQSLQKRARRNGRSMEAEVRDILRNAVNEDSPRRRLGTELSSLFTEAGLDSDIAELRGHEVKPASFRK